MSEFNITQWSDFVRGLADPEMAEQMVDLEGEPNARRTVEALRRVAAVGRADHDSPVPPSAVRIAKAIAGASRAKATPSVRRIPLVVAFDSLLQAAPAGARNLQQSHRELTFEARGYSVDLRMETTGEPTHEGTSNRPSARKVVVGQLLRRGAKANADPGAASESGTIQSGPVSRAPVFMFSGEHLIGTAVTGRHGEFQIEGSLQGREASGDASPRASLDLCLVAGDDYLELPLPAESGVVSES